MLFKTFIAVLAIFFMTLGGYLYRKDEDNISALAAIVSGYTILFTMQW